MTRVARIAFLTAIWVLMWGDLSVANVASGALVSMLLLVFFPVGASESARRTRVGTIPTRAWGWVVLTGHVVAQLIASNVNLSREIVRRRSRIRTGIVACPLRSNSERTITFVANVLALSPGTMPIEVQSDPATIYVHVLHLDDPDVTRRSVAKLEALTLRAFGVAVDSDAAHEVAT